MTPHAARRAAHGGLVVLFFLALAGVYTYPLAVRPASTLLIGLGDYPTETSMVAWNAWALFHEPGRLFQPPNYYPYSNGVAYQQSAFFSGLLAAPLLAAGLEPIHAVNLVLLAELVASGALTYLLAYSVTGRVLPSLLAGTVFAFYPNRMDHIGQFTFQQAFLYPLIVWAWARYLAGGRWTDLLVAAAALWGQLLSSLYNGYALLFLLGALTLGVLALRPRFPGWRAVGRVLLVGAALGLALLPFALPYVAVHRELGFQRTLDEADYFGMDLLSILDPGRFNWLYEHHLVFLDRSEGGLFPGFVALALAACAAVLACRGEAAPPLPRWARWAGRALAGAAAVTAMVIGMAAVLGKVTIEMAGVRLLRLRTLTRPVRLLPVLALAGLVVEGRRGRAGPLTSREWTFLSLFLALVAYLLCLSPHLFVRGVDWGSAVFQLVYQYVPGGSAFRAPGRWSLVFVLPLALLVALGAAEVARRVPSPWRHVVPGLLLAVMLAEYAVVIPWQRLPARPPVYDWVRTQPGDFAILQLPIYERASDAWAMLWATYHHKRVVNGHGGFALAAWQELVDAAEARDPELLAVALRSIYPLRYVVVHPFLLGPVWAPVVDLIRQGRVAPLVLERAFAGDEVYRVIATPDRGSVIHRYFSSDWARRHPVVEYRVRLAADDPEIRQEVEVRLNGALLRRHAGPTSERVRLTSPLHDADRNDLVFRHAYSVLPATARRDAYRIGQTQTHSPVDIEVQSAGRDVGRTASIRVNGLEVIPHRYRGYWVASLAPVDGRVLAVEVFDTHHTVAESARLAAHIQALPVGTVVAVAALDEVSWQLTDEAVGALQSLGGHLDPRGALARSHALIGVRGARPGQAVEAMGPRPVSLTVGRQRAGLVLEAFDSR